MLVEKSNSLEDFAPVAAAKYCIDPTRPSGADPKIGIPDAKTVTQSRCDGQPDQRFLARPDDDNATHIISLVLLSITD